MSEAKGYRSFIVAVIAVALLAVLSLADWETLTAGKLTNFNLFADVMADVRCGESTVTEDSTEQATVVSNMERLPVPIETDSEVVAEFVSTAPTPPLKRVVKEGVQAFEDYTPNGVGLSRLKVALSESQTRLIRVAFLGDSYIEGDIFTQDVRRLLQDRYGGGGVGYMSMHSEFPGFRRSVRQADNGWEMRDVRQRNKMTIVPFAGEYALSTENSKATFNGTKTGNGKTWSSSKLLCITSVVGEVTLAVDSCTEVFPLASGNQVQCLELEGETSKLSVATSVPGVKIIGAWLDGNTGVGVDCMSIRGSAGGHLGSLSVELMRDFSNYIMYDLIVLEYGMNTLSAGLSNYDYYGHQMVKAVKHLQQCFPNADIVLLGVGDRGEKKGTAVKSMAEAEALVNAQRKCAAECGVLFWDTRQAMGGDGAVAQWRKQGLVNADYIHLNHKGGAELAHRFVKSLIAELDE